MYVIKPESTVYDISITLDETVIANGSDLTEQRQSREAPY